MLKQLFELNYLSFIIVGSKTYFILISHQHVIKEKQHFIDAVAQSGALFTVSGTDYVHNGTLSIEKSWESQLAEPKVTHSECLFYPVNSASHKSYKERETLSIQINSWTRRMK